MVGAIMKNYEKYKGKKALLIIITISFLISMHTVRAMDAAHESLVINCENSTTKPGEEIKCSITGTPDLYGYIYFELKTDNNNVVVKDFKLAEGLTLLSNDGYLIDARYGTSGTFDFDVATFSLSVSDNFKINNDVDVKVSISSGFFISDGHGYSIDPVSATIVVRPNHNYLLGAKFIGYDIGFDINKTEYNLTVENEVQKLAVCNNYEDENMLCIDVNSVEFAAKTDITSFTLNGQDLEEKLFDFDENIEENCNEDEKICEYILNDEVVGISEVNEEGIRKSWSKLGNLKVGLNELKLTITGEEGSDEYIFKINRLSENRNDTLTDSNKEEIIENPKTGAFISLSSLTFVATVSTYVIVKLKKKNIFYD